MLEKLKWYDIDQKGNINLSLKDQAAIYIYQYKNQSLNKNPCCYVGSTINLRKRTCSHRHYIVNWDKYKGKGDRTRFYRSIVKYSLVYFKFGVLEYVAFPYNMNIKEKKRILLEKEQYYLDTLNPYLNTCKVANSPLGVKHDITFSINMSKAHRGKKK